MSLSISKLLQIASSEDQKKKDLEHSDVPNRMNITHSQYFKSVRRPPKNSQNIVMSGTPLGGIDKTFAIDGSIDPNYIRNQTHPEQAQPDRFWTGSEGLLYATPPSTWTSHNNVSLIQQAKQSYFNRMNRYNPKQKSGDVAPPIVPESSVQAERIGHRTPNKSMQNDNLFA